MGLANDVIKAYKNEVNDTSDKVEKRLQLYFKAIDKENGGNNLEKYKVLKAVLFSIAITDAKSFKLVKDALASVSVAEEPID